MSDIKYKVYDPESDELRFLTDDEQNLLQRLQQCEEFLYTGIINQHLNESNDRIDSLDRLREIFNFYLRHHRAFQSERRMVYFLDRSSYLKTLFLYVEGLWIDKDSEEFGSTPKPQVRSSDFIEKGSLISEEKKSLAPNPPLSLETLIPISKLNVLRTLLVKHQVLTADEFNWIDKSYGYKGKASAFIQVLERKGYFGAQKFNGQEISQILKNSFGISVSGRTANDSYYSAELDRFDFIPPSSTLS